MSNFFKNLYTNFLLRDILAKAVPGFIVLAYIFQGKMPIAHPKQGFPEIVVITVIYGLSFMTGMLLQFLGSRKIPRTNWSFIRIYVHNNDQDVSLKKLEEFLNTTKDREVLRHQRERFVILKNMAGTYAIALLAILVLEFAKYLSRMIYPFPIALLMLFFLFLALWGQNRFHANEQKVWEEMITDGNNEVEDIEDG